LEESLPKFGEDIVPRMTAPLAQGMTIHPPAIGLGTICEPIL
jgi:hypothetical protein